MHDRSFIKLAISYIAVLIGSIGIYLAINTYGTDRFQLINTVKNVTPKTVVDSSNILHLLIALVIIIALARLIGKLFTLIHQPAVIGEVVGGIILGPSLLGRMSPDFMSWILPQTVVPYLSILAQFGLILYMFLVGLELDLKVLRKSGHATLAISHASIVFPFLLGVSLALILFSTHAPSGVSFTSFSLFLGISMSITAFPILARILTDKNLHKTDLGILALSCAAIDDVTAWCLLALVVSIMQSTVSSAVLTFVLTVLFIIFMFIIAKPFLSRWINSIKGKLTENHLALLLLGLLCSALATEAIGIHAIFGAFLFGAIIPHESSTAEDLTHRMFDLVRVLFLPAFFAFTGMRTQFGLLSDYSDWLLCILIIVIATVGKFGGTLLAARWVGMKWKDSLALGALMNTRGLVELIVLNIGLDLNVISPRLFAMLVMMALVTTFATGPLLKLIMVKDLK